MLTNILQYVKDNNIEYFNYCSDLYIYVTDETKEIIDQYEFKCNVTTFISQIDNKAMYEIPFAFTDYYKGRK